MSVRLSDTRLEVVGTLAENKAALGATACDTRLMVAELRERRAADLSAEEREALAFVRREVDEEIAWTVDRETKQLRRLALAALDKLIGGGK